MKKYLLPLFSFFLLLISPSIVKAAVDITAEDTSTTSQKEVTISVDTNTDKISTVNFRVQASDDVTVTTVENVSGLCDTFSYTNTENLISVECSLTTAASISGEIATISFTSTGTAYTFEIMDDSTLDLGDLTLGTITNIEDTTVTATDTTETDTTTTTTTSTSETASITDTIMEYLPYILIGGAAILLISIVGILLSKKKEKAPQVETPVQESVAPEPNSIDNQPVNMDNVSPSLYTPTEEPTLKEKIETPETEVSSEVSVPQVDQTKDLKDILSQSSPEDRMEAQVPPVPTEAPAEEPVNPAMAEMQTFINNQNTTPSEVSEVTPVQPIQEENVVPIPEVPQAVPDLQNFVNTQVSQLPEDKPVQDIVPPVTPSPEVNPLPNMEESTNMMPPIPPIAPSPEVNPLPEVNNNMNMMPPVTPVPQSEENPVPAPDTSTQAGI